MKTLIKLDQAGNTNVTNGHANGNGVAIGIGDNWNVTLFFLWYDDDIILWRICVNTKNNYYFTILQ